MESDDRERRLRSDFGFMMVWTALTIGIFGYLLGILLDSLFAAAGYFLGFTLGESGHTLLQVSGHVLVGTAVAVGLVQSYLSPDRLPDALLDDE